MRQHPISRASEPVQPGPADDHRISSQGVNPETPVVAAKIVPDSIRATYAAQTTLRQFYEHCRDGRWEPVGRINRSKAAGDCDLRAIRAWEMVNKAQPYGGPTLAEIERASRSWMVGMFERMKCEPLNYSVGTINGAVRNHLLTVIRHARKVCAISRVPESETVSGDIVHEDIYTRDDVDQILDRLIELNAGDIAQAFAVACVTGLRAIDLFQLRCSDLKTDSIGRWVIHKRAKKTGREQAIPLHDTIIKLLIPVAKIGEPDDLLWPRLSVAIEDNEDPERSKPARWRNQTIKAVQRELQIIRHKPWQVARKTCNEALEATHEGVGQFVLGHALTGVNAKNYRQPTRIVFDTVRSVPPYESLLRMLGATLQDEPYGGVG